MYSWPSFLCPAHLIYLCVLFVQLVDRRRELVRVQLVPSFTGTVVAGGEPQHVLCDEVLPPAAGGEDEGGALKGFSGAGSGLSDGLDRLLEYRCGRYLYSEAQATFLPIPGLPTDFASQLHRVATDRSIQGVPARSAAGSRVMCAEGGGPACQAATSGA